MSRTAWIRVVWSVGLLALPAGVVAGGGQRGPANPFISDFRVEKSDLTATGRNTYFILEPGYELVLEGGGEHVTVTVLNETKVVDGVETRVSEERETRAGRLVELTRNYFAISKQTSDVFYFGEAVDNYDRSGKVVNHAGTWLSGVKGARFGLYMPAQPQAKARFYQEYLPGVAMDRTEVLSTAETVTTPAGTFTGCLKIKETTPVEPGNVVYKVFAPGVGLVISDQLKLVKYGRAKPTAH
jgi:hypothetical protein